MRGTADEQRRRKEDVILNQIRVGNPVNRLEYRDCLDRCSLDSLSGGTEPGAEPRAVGTCLVAFMLSRMTDTGRGHEPVHQNETYQQGPHQS